MSTRWLPSLRRLSIFYFFLLAMAIGLVAYYVFYIPRNKNQFASRASRELKTLVFNFRKQVRDLDSTFSQKSLRDTDNWKKFRNHEEPYLNLYENFSYQVADSQNPVEKRLDRTNGDWKLGFPANKPDIALPLSRFGNLFFSSRTGVFDSYIVLRASTDFANWNIVYRNPRITTSDQLILDTSKDLYRNTDMSTVAEVTVGGRVYKLFMQPFTLGEERLVMGGLITKSDYADYVYTISTDAIIVSVILIVLVLIILPLVKIYFLSPNERIYSRDVIACTASLFIGTAAVLLILVFEYLIHISSDSLHNRMVDVGKQIKQDVEQQLEAAGKQLEAYNIAYSKLPSDKHQKVLAQEIKDDSIMHQVDSMFYPRIFPGLTRVLWVDSAGNTMAKWNPFNYTTPLTSVKEYEFFKRLHDIHKQVVPAEALVVYSGKSNITGEFQVYIVKPTQQRIYNGGKTYPSIGVLMATSLHCNAFPVLPPGFGFCIMDEDGEVLLHSDERRNLAENIFVETGYDERVMRSIQLDRNALLTDVNLYGKSHDLVIRSVRDQPLSIVVFYAQKNVISNIARFLHFSIANLLYLFMFLAAFIFYFSYRKVAPSKLRFSLNTEEWIRPSASNENAYRFTHVYFKRLVAVTVATFLFIQWFQLDFRNILYLSLLLPFYGMMALIIARKKLIKHDATPFDVRDYFRRKNTMLQDASKKRMLFSFLYKQATNSMPVLGFVLLLSNIFCILSLSREKGNVFVVSLITLIGIQCIFVVLLYRYLKRISENPANNMAANQYVQWDPARVPNNYLRLLYFTLIIAVVLPCFGITTYAFFAEKMQYKKNKELLIASQFERKYQDLQTKRAAYKPYLRRLDSLQHVDDSLLTKGIYLSDRDAVSLSITSSRANGAIYDGPYQVVVNRIYGYTMPLFGEFAIANNSGDSNSWKFGTNDNSLFLYYKGKGIDPPDIVVQSVYRNPLENFLLVLRGGGIIFPLIIGFFLIFLYWCTRDLMRRLLFLEFITPIEPKTNFLDEYFEKNRLDPLYAAKGEKYLSLESVLQQEKPRRGQEEYILQLNFKLAPVYAKVWADLSDNEMFILYDLCRDGFTNYKNTDTFYKLLNKGILVFDDYKVKPFSYSFRNFVLAQKDTEKMQGILRRNSIGGVWRSLRVPVLLIVAIVTVFFVLTQNEVAQDLTAFISSLVAIIPLLIQFLGRSSSKDQ